MVAGVLRVVSRLDERQPVAELLLDLRVILLLPGGEVAALPAGGGVEERCDARLPPPLDGVVEAGEDRHPACLVFPQALSWARAAPSRSLRRPAAPTICMFITKAGENPLLIVGNLRDPFGLLVV